MPEGCTDAYAETTAGRNGLRQKNQQACGTYHNQIKLYGFHYRFTNKELVYCMVMRLCIFHNTFAVSCQDNYCQRNKHFYARGTLLFAFRSVIVRMARYG
jgi:hypothetical protein